MKLFFLLVLLLASAAFSVETQPAEGLLNLGAYYESYGTPEFDSLLEEFDYDDSIAAGTTEIDSMERLLGWVHNHMRFGYTSPTCTRDGLCALRNSPDTTYDCVNFTAAFMQCAQSLGWVVRPAFFPSDTKCEIWSNQFNKWVFFDPVWDVYIVNSDSIPLSIAEVREQYAKGFLNGESYIYSFGVNRNAYTQAEAKGGISHDDTMSIYLTRDLYAEVFMITLRSFIITRTNWFTAVNQLNPGYIIWDDWDQNELSWYGIWGPGGSNQNGNSFGENNIEFLYYDIGRTDIFLTEYAADTCIVNMRHDSTNNFTPNFSRFQVRVNGGAWGDSADGFKWSLSATDTLLEFRTVNDWGVGGHPTKVKLKQGDVTPPAMSAVAYAVLNDTTIKVSFLTNEYAAVKMQYGESPTFDSTAYGTHADTTHAFTLMQVPHDSLFYWQATLTDALGNRDTTAVWMYRNVRTKDTSFVLNDTLTNEDTTTVQISTGNTYGKLRVRVYDSFEDTASSDKSYTNVGYQIGFMNAAGSWIALGMNRRSTDAWNKKLTMTESDDLEYIWKTGAFNRTSGWSTWILDYSRSGTFNITRIGNDTTKAIAYNFRWPWDSVTTGFNRLFFKGEGATGPETLIVDSVTFTRYSSDSTDNFYVCKDGSNSNNGRLATPWLTVDKAASTNLSGDTAFIAPGDYSEIITTDYNGTSTNRITFYAAEQCTTNRWIISKDYVTIENFNLRDSTGEIIYLDGDSCRILNNTFKMDTSARNIECINIEKKTAPTSPGASVGAIIRGNHFFDFTYVGINVYGVGHLIENNHFKQAWMDPLNVWGHDHIIRKNEFEDIGNKAEKDINHEDIIQTFPNYSYNAYNIVFEQNYIHDCINCQIGVIMEGYHRTGKVDNWVFRNNIFSNIEAQLSFGADSCSVDNNVFYRVFDTRHAVSFSLDTSDSNHGIADHCNIRNNVFIACGTSSTDPTQGFYQYQTGVIDGVRDYNMATGSDYSAKSTTSGTPQFNFLDEHGINGGNPMVADTAAKNFQLLEGSPLIGAGINLSTLFTNDYNDSTRQSSPATWDIGAFMDNGYTPPVYQKKKYIIQRVY